MWQRPHALCLIVSILFSSILLGSQPALSQKAKEPEGVSARVAALETLVTALQAHVTCQQMTLVALQAQLTAAQTKGYDPLAHVKVQAAQRWVAAVNAAGQYGRWHYAVAYKPEEVRWHIEAIVSRMREEETTAAEST